MQVTRGYAPSISARKSVNVCEVYENLTAYLRASRRATRESKFHFTCTVVDAILLHRGTLKCSTYFRAGA